MSLLAAPVYQYLKLFIGWHDVSRDPVTGTPRADPERFPNGIKAVSGKVHALGLKVICSKSVSFLTGAIRMSHVSTLGWYIQQRREVCQGGPRSGSTLTGTDRYTCGGRFGSLGYEEIDAKTYAEWGIDYLSEISSCSSALGLALSCSRDQSMITATMRARVGLRLFHSTGTQRCLAH